MSGNTAAEKLAALLKECVQQTMATSTVTIVDSVNELLEQQKSLEIDLAALRKEVAEMRADIAAVRNDMADMRSTTTTLHGAVDRLAGSGHTGPDPILLRKQCEIDRKVTGIMDEVARIRVADDLRLGLTPGGPSNMLAAALTEPVANAAIPVTDK